MPDKETINDKNDLKESSKFGKQDTFHKIETPRYNTQKTKPNQIIKKPSI